MSKQPTPDELRERLSAGHFGKSKKVPPGDPVQPTPMVVPVTKIDLYGHNPRAVINEKYEEIKESIRTSGLEQPLSITRRPGAENYMMDAGGNTRLKILKELHQQYPDDPRFFNIHVLYQPWESEAHVLAKHLKENDLRGALTFIDRARGIAKMRVFLEQGREKPLSYRELAQALQKKGYRIDASALSRLEYAHNTLLPLIPLALEGGLGQPQVEKIRRIEKALLKYLLFLEHEDREGPLTLWHECLAEVDTGEGALPIDTAYENLAQRLEPLLHYANAQSILIDLDMLQEGKTLSRYEPPPELLDSSQHNGEDTGSNDAPGAKKSPPTPQEPSTETQSAPTHGSEGAQETQSDIFGETVGHTTATTAPPTPKEKDTGAASPQSKPIAPAPGSSPETSEAHGAAKPLPNDIKSLRARLWTQAMRLAQPAGLANLIMRTNGGAGYWIDLPKAPLVTWSVGGNPLGGTIMQSRRVIVWWMLMELAEQSMAVQHQADPPEVLAPEELVNTRWAIYLAENNGHKGMERIIGTPQYHLGIALRNLDPRSLAILIDMLQAKEKLASLLGRPASIWIPDFKWPETAHEPEKSDSEADEDSDINYDDGPWEDPWRGQE